MKYLKSLLLIVVQLISVNSFSQIVVRDLSLEKEGLREIIIGNQVTYTRAKTDRINQSQLQGAYSDIYLDTKIIKDSLGQISLQLLLSTSDDYNNSFSGDKLIVLLASGQSITFDNPRYDFFYGHGFFIYKLSQENLVLLKNSFLSGIKVYTKTREFEIALRKQNLGQIQKTFALTYSMAEKLTNTGE